MSEDRKKLPSDCYLFLLGDISVGKTALFKKIGGAKFEEIIISSIGIDKKTLYYDSNLLKEHDIDLKDDDSFILYDTLGDKDQLKTMKNFLGEPDGVVIVYDISNPKSLENIDSWIQFVKENYHIKYDNTIFLLGNKKDKQEGKENSKPVSEEEANNICKSKNLIWGGEVSAKDCSQAELLEIFLKFFKIIIENKQKEPENLPNKNKKKKGCCPCLE